MKKNLILLTFFFISLLLRGQNERYVIPFTIEGRHLSMIECTINGKGPYKFIFDTGASTNIIKKELSEELGLVVVDTLTLRTPIDPKGIESLVVRIDKISLAGDFKKENITATVDDFSRMPGLNCDGIIGLAFFDNFLVEIDYAKKELGIEEGTLDNIPNTIKCSTEPILSCNIIIDGKEYTANFDSGSPALIALPYDWKDNFSFSNEPILVGKGRLMSGEFEIYRAQIKGEIIISDIILKDPEVDLNTGGFNVITIGQQLLNNKKIVIDQKNQLMKVL